MLLPLSEEFIADYPICLYQKALNPIDAMVAKDLGPTNVVTKNPFVAKNPVTRNASEAMSEII